MVDLDLNELERLEKAATPGPWAWNSYGSVCTVNEPCYAVCALPRRHGDEATKQGASDARFIEAVRNALPELLRRLRAAEVDRIAHERAAHEADLRTQAAVRAENAAQARIAELEAHLQSIIEAYDANSGAEPSVSVLDRAIDAARRP